MSLLALLAGSMLGLAVLGRTLFDTYMPVYWTRQGGPSVDQALESFKVVDVVANAGQGLAFCLLLSATMAQRAIRSREAI